jgi:hypothetical protein
MGRHESTVNGIGDDIIVFNDQEPHAPTALDQPR